MTRSTADLVVLAYSGGLDTSVAIGWIAEETGAEVIAVAGRRTGRPNAPRRRAADRPYAEGGGSSRSEPQGAMDL